MAESTVVIPQQKEATVSAKVTLVDQINNINASFNRIETAINSDILLVKEGTKMIDELETKIAKIVTNDRYNIDNYTKNYRSPRK